MQRLLSARFYRLANPQALRFYAATNANMASADPYTAKASEESTPEQKVKEVSEIIKEVKTGMLVTKAANGAMHARAMAPASKEGLIFDFIANNNSGKFDELEANPDVNISFYNHKTTDWISITGKAKVINDKEKVKALFNPVVSAWFGDLTDGKHDGSADDPRVSAIEVVPDEIRYWLKTSSSISQAYQVAKGAVTGETAAPGVLRTLNSADLALARQMANK